MTLDEIERILRGKTALLLDANILIVLVIGLIHPRHLRRFPRTSAYGRIHFETVERIWNFCAATNRPVLTTPHILTETSNLLGKGWYGETGRNKLAALVRQSKEKTPAAEELSKSPRFAELGITDIAIETLCDPSTLVLTDDFALAGLLKSKGVPTHHLRWTG